MILPPRKPHAAVSDLASRLLTGHAADLRPMPSTPLGTGADRQVRRYRPPEGVVPAGPPVLLIPPPATSARCYDLRRGCSLAEHVVRAGRRCYVLDPRCGGERFPASGRVAGLDHWIGEEIAGAIHRVSADSAGQPVQLVGWCMGGLLSLLTAAADPGLPIASVAVIATPGEPPAVPPPAVPPRPLTSVTRGLDAATADAFLGAPPWPGLARACRTAGGHKYLARPYALLRFLDDTAFLSQIDAVDRVSNAMPAYLGHPAVRLYRSLFQDNAVAGGDVEVAGRQATLAQVRAPVLVVAGQSDVLAPVSAVRSLTRLLDRSPQVRFEVAPGGHLGVLTGRHARATTWRHLDRWFDEGIVRHGLRPHRREATSPV